MRKYNRWKIFLQEFYILWMRTMILWPKKPLQQNFPFFKKTKVLTICCYIEEQNTFTLICSCQNLPQEITSELCLLVTLIIVSSTLQSHSLAILSQSYMAPPPNQNICRFPPTAQISNIISAEAVLENIMPIKKAINSQQ